MEGVLGFFVLDEAGLLEKLLHIGGLGAPLAEPVEQVRLDAPHSLAIIFNLN